MQNLSISAVQVFPINADTFKAFTHHENLYAVTLSNGKTIHAHYAAREKSFLEHLTSVTCSYALHMHLSELPSDSALINAINSACIEAYKERYTCFTDRHEFCQTISDFHAVSVEGVSPFAETMVNGDFFVSIYADEYNEAGKTYLVSAVKGTFGLDGFKYAEVERAAFQKHKFTQDWKEAQALYKRYIIEATQEMTLGE